MQPATSATLPQLNDAPQAIAFSEREGLCSAEVVSKTVIIGTDAGKHNHGSSKVKLKNVVDYNWELRYYTGQLLAVHKGGNYLAYAMKVPNKSTVGAWSGMVRVLYKDKRVLLKEMKGEIQDLEFAYIDNQVILASIDENGHTYIHSIELVDDELRSSLVVEMLNDEPAPRGRHRVVWCPYIPDEDDADMEPEEDNARLLLTTHYNTARIWKMWGIVNGLEKGVHTVTTKSVLESENPNLVTVSDHTAAIVDAAFSPDGTALATASADGYVMFFQVYMHNEKTPRCLHRWQPHGGKPLSCLFFLDNHRNYSSDVQFWKFAVTGADNNQVIKIWCCKSWDCRQTITFAPDILADPLEPMGFKAVLDAGAEYLLLSDFKRRCLYVMHMRQEAGDNMAYCKSIAEFLLPFPVLSFAVVDAGTRTIACSSRCGDPYHTNGGQDEDGGSPVVFNHADEDPLEPQVNGDGDTDGTCGQKVQLRLYVLQPKGLQEGRLLYTPPPLGGSEKHERQSDADSVPLAGLSPDPTLAEPLETLNASFLQQQSQQLKNILLRARGQPGSLLRADSPTCVQPSAPQLNLMTPDAFSSPGKRDEDDPPIATTPDPNTEPRIPAHVLIKSPPPVYELEEAPPKYTSAGSSPSREVQEILSLKDSEFYKDDLVETGATPETAVDGDPMENGASGYEHYIDADMANPEPKETIWPSITLAQINEANQRKASSDKSANQSINNSIVNADLSNVDMSINEEENGSDVNQVVQRIEQMSLSSQDRSRLDAIELKLEKITDMMAEQNRLLRALREDNAANDPRQTIEHSLHAHTQQTTAAIDNAFDQRWGRVEAAAAQAGAGAADAVSAAMARVLDPLARSLQHEFATRMTATDALLRDNIEKLVHSKSIQESLGNAVTRTLSGMVRESFRDVIAQTLVPTVEKATAQIFKQVNQAFQAGTKEFAANTQAYARTAAERGGAAAVETLCSQLQRHADTLANANSQPQQLAMLHNAVRGVLEQEMSRWREQAASVLEMSRSQTPLTPRVAHTPHQIVDRQKSRRLSNPQPKCRMQIDHLSGNAQYSEKWKKVIVCHSNYVQLGQISSLLNTGDVNGAFQVALSASDLSLVVHACRAADPARVFAPNCQLKQNVLLSLVQQLAADMTHDTQLKHRYLEEAIINLDAMNPVTREHMPVVVRELKRQLTSFLSANPTHQLARQIKMLLMATESLLNLATM